MSSKYDDLEKLRDLFAKGILSEAEFNAEKEKVLNADSELESRVETVDDNQKFNALMHLSQFTNFLFPFLGLIIPIVMWASRKEESKSVDINGRIILNWIISMTIYVVISIGILLIVGGVFVFSSINELISPFTGLFGSLALLLLPILIFTILDFVFTIIGAIKAGNGEIWNYPLSIRFFKTNL